MKKHLDFIAYIKQKRTKDFIKPYELAYESFLGLGMNKKPKEYFFSDASDFIESMRNKCWQNFLIAEETFSKLVFKSLSKQEYYEGMSNNQAVEKFIDVHVQDFYTLSLSNTQSRRCRAGAEFEAIVELLFMASGIMIDSQGFLSSGIFKQHSLGKAVDLVSPGVLEYELFKRNCALISCKTSLRERWAEVIEEKERTGASEVFLATLDEKISKSTLEILNTKNVMVVVTKKLKEEKYLSYSNVITYEHMLNIVSDKNKYWNSSVYPPEKIIQRIDILDKQVDKHNKLSHEFIKDYYNSLKNNLYNSPDEPLSTSIQKF